MILGKTYTEKMMNIMAEEVKKPQKRRRLKVAHPERCIGCLGCMFACSRTNAKTASLQDSAIKIQTQGGIEGDFRVVVCRGCQDARCARACRLCVKVILDQYNGLSFWTRESKGLHKIRIIDLLPCSFTQTILLPARGSNARKMQHVPLRIYS